MEQPTIQYHLKKPTQQAIISAFYYLQIISLCIKPTGPRVSDHRVPLGPPTATAVLIIWKYMLKQRANAVMIPTKFSYSIFPIVQRP